MPGFGPLQVPASDSDLVTVLTLDRLITLVQGIAAQPEIWRPRVRFGSHERWATHLHRDDELDLWLTTWQPTTRPDMHSHVDSVAVFTVVEGSLEEERIGPDGHALLTTLSHGVIRPVGTGISHDLRNVSFAPAISIHAAAPDTSAAALSRPLQRAASRPHAQTV